MSRPIGDVTARGVTEIGEATSSTVSGYTFTTIVSLTAPTPVAEWQAQGTRVFAVRQDGRHYLQPLAGPPATPTIGDLWLENVAGVTHLRFQGLQGLVTADTGTAGITSITLTAPGQFSVSGSPLTSNGTLGFSWVNQSANLVLAGPTSGSAAPTFRALVPGDLPGGLPYLPASGGTTGYLATWSSASAIQATQYLPAGNFPALSGDITTTAGSLATALTSVITAGGPIGSTSTTPVITWDAKGRLTAVTSATITPSAIGALPASGGTTGYLATWSSSSALTATQYLPAGNHPALTGDVTSSAGSLGTTIAAGAVTLAKMANLAANSIIGNNTGSPATPLALTAGQVSTFLGLGYYATGTSAANLTGTVPYGTLPLFTSTTPGAVNLSGGGTTNFLRADGTWAAPGGTVGGSGVANQVAYWSAGTTLTGSSGLTFNGTNLVVGSDPGGSELLRVGGSIRASGTTHAFGVVATTGATLLVVDGGNSGTNGGSATYYRQNGVSQVAIGNYSAVIGGAYDARGVIYAPQGLAVNPTSGAVTVGTDPGGSELLRVGGTTRFGGGAIMATSALSTFGLNTTSGTSYTFNVGSDLNGFSVYDVNRSTDVLRADRSGNLTLGGGVGAVLAGSRGGVGYDHLDCKQYIVTGSVSIQYALLAVLPVSTAGTYDCLIVDGLIGDWGSQQGRIDCQFRNRGGLKGQANLNTAIGSGAAIVAYQDVSGTASIYLRMSSGYWTASVRLSSNLQGTVQVYGALTTTAPTGTLVFDSSATTSSEFHGPLAINNPPSVGATDVVQINGGIIATGSGEFRLSSSAGLVEVGAISQNYWSLPSYSGSLLRFYGSTNGSTFAGVSTNSLGALIFQNVANCLIGSNGQAPLTFMMASNAVGTITAAGQWVIGASDPGGSQAFRVGASGLFQGTLTVQNAGTTDRLVLQGAAVGSSSNTLTVITPATAMGANFQQTLQARTGIVALQGEGLWTNLVINGDLQVDQRNTQTTPVTLTSTTVGAFGPDCWVGLRNNATHVVTIGRVAVVNTPMVGSVYACKLNVTTGATVGALERLSLGVNIEGTFFRRCAFGTAQAATLYVSFWAESSATGTFSVSLRNAGVNRSYVVNCTISAANTRQLFQFTVPGDTAGAWANDTSTYGILMNFVAACGSTFQTASTATWLAGNFVGTSSTTLLNTITGSLQISDLYVGTTPIGGATTDFPRLPFDAELARCQRYYWHTFSPGVTPAQNVGVGTGELSWVAVLAGANQNRVVVRYPVPMRVTPLTTTLYNPAAANGQVRDISASLDCTAATVARATSRNLAITSTGTASTNISNELGVHISCSAEFP